MLRASQIKDRIYSSLRASWIFVFSTRIKSVITNSNTIRHVLVINCLLISNGWHFAHCQVSNITRGFLKADLQTNYTTSVDTLVVGIGPLTQISTFSANGHLIKSECFKNGILEGPAAYITIINSHGIYESGNYVSGQKRGTWLVFFVKRNLKNYKLEEVQYINSNVIRTARNWNSKGKLIFEQDCDETGETCKYRQFDQRGNLIRETDYPVVEVLSTNKHDK